MNTHNKTEIQNAINEIVVCMDRMATEREQIASILKTLKERFQVNTKAIRRIASATHRGNLGESMAELNEMQEVFDSIVDTQ